VTRPPSGEDRPSRTHYWIWTIGSILAGAYLIALAVGLLKPGQLGIAEGIMFLTILILNPDVIRRIDSLSLSAGKFDVKLSQVESTQKRQQKDIDELTFLITNYLPEVELVYLQELQKGISSTYWFTPKYTYAPKEHLRHLREMGLIAHKNPRLTITLMPDEGPLNEFFQLTELGKRYLELRRRAEPQV
jgi:hypothetical protein